MIYHTYRVWKRVKYDKVSVQISKVSVGDQIAVLPEGDKDPIFLTVKSIIPVFSSSIECLFAHKPTLYLANESEVLTTTGFAVPVKFSQLVCSTELVRVVSIKKALTAKKFYSILLESPAPVIIEDGYVLRIT